MTVQRIPPALNSPVPIYTPGLPKNTTQCPPARARTRTARSGDEHTNHEATAPPTCGVINNKSDVKLNNFDFTCGKLLANGDIHR